MISLMIVTVASIYIIIREQLYIRELRKELDRYEKENQNFRQNNRSKV